MARRISRAVTATLAVAWLLSATVTARQPHSTLPDPIGDLLELPAPPPPWQTEALGTAVIDTSTPPDENASLQTLLRFWVAASGQISVDQLSPALRERLLEACEENPKRLREIIEEGQCQRSYFLRSSD